MDNKAVREAAEQFYFALYAMFAGDWKPIKKVWSHADDVTYMGHHAADSPVCSSPPNSFVPPTNSKLPVEPGPL